MDNSEWFASTPTDVEDPVERAPAPTKTGEKVTFVEDEEYDAQAQVMPGVTTGALLDAMESPGALEQVARGDLYVHLARLRRRVSDFAPTQQLEYAKFLSKIGKVDSAAPADASPLQGVPFIKIDLGNGNSLSLGSAARTEKDITPDEDDHDG